MRAPTRSGRHKIAQHVVLGILYPMHVLLAGHPWGFTRVVPCGQWGLNRESVIRTFRTMFLYRMMK